MANRSMLFAASDIPDGSVKQELKVIGLGEFNYQVPIVYQLLVSTAPRLCRSCVFDEKACLAIAGDADGGLASLVKVRDVLPDRAVAFSA